MLNAIIDTTRIMSQNPKYTKKIEIVQLVEVVAADPFDATETCSICSEGVRRRRASWLPSTWS